MLSRRTLKFRQNLLGACHCMFTVIKALFLRETHTLYGSDKLGYIWALQRDVFSVGFIIVIRIVFGMRFEKGLHIVYFCLSGFFVYYIVTECVDKCISALRANSAILAFPHVIPLDIMISRSLFSFFTNIQAAIVVIIIAVSCGLPFEITDLALFLFSAITALLFGFSLGIFMSAITIFYPIIEKVWSIMSRILIIVSGVVISLDRFPSMYAEPLKLNPIFQIIEGLRKSISHSIDLVDEFSFSYIYFYILIFFTLGLFLQNAARERLNQ